MKYGSTKYLAQKGLREEHDLRLKIFNMSNM